MSYPIYPTLPHDLNSPIHPVSAMDYLPVAPLRALQLHRLQWTVKWAYERVPIFRQRCQERGVRPEHIQTLADIKLVNTTLSVIFATSSLKSLGAQPVI